MVCLKWTPQPPRTKTAVATLVALIGAVAFFFWDGGGEAGEAIESSNPTPAEVATTEHVPDERGTPQTAKAERTPVQTEATAPQPPSTSEKLMKEKKFLMCMSSQIQAPSHL